MLRIHAVHPLEVVEILEEDGRLHETVQAGARLLENGAQVREDLLRLLLDRAAAELVRTRLQRKLSRDEDEAARADRLRVRRALERRGRRLRPHHCLVSHAPLLSQCMPWPAPLRAP